ncbi:MAG: hypothetical protein V1748_13085 [Actinomycetota bacterium]
MNGRRSMRTAVLAGLASLLVIAAVVAVVMLISGDRKAGTSSRLGGVLTAGTVAGTGGATTAGDSGSPGGDPVAGSPSSTSGSSTGSPSGSSIPGTTPGSTTPPPASSSPPGPATSSPPAPATSSPPAPAVPSGIWLTDFSGGGEGSLSQSSGTFPLAAGGRLRLHINVARIHLDQPMDCWVRIHTEGGGYEIGTFTNTQNVFPSYTNPTSGTAYVSVATTNCTFSLTLSHEF